MEYPGKKGGGKRRKALKKIILFRGGGGEGRSEKRALERGLGGHKGVWGEREKETILACKKKHCPKKRPFAERKRKFQLNPYTKGKRKKKPFWRNVRSSALRKEAGAGPSKGKEKITGTVVPKKPPWKEKSWGTRKTTVVYLGAQKKYAAKGKVSPGIKERG